MIDRRTLPILLAGVGALAALAWGLAPSLPTADAASSSAAEAEAAADLQQLDREIVFFERRAEEDPYSADDFAMLAMRFLQRARETGNHEDVVRAEESARRSLELRESHNSGTWAVLSASLLEQHRFTEARDAAQRLMEWEPEEPAYRAHLAEIELELGRYDRAKALFTSLEPARTHLDVAPRLARWLELSGRPQEARSLLHAARERALARRDLPREQRAWFHLRVGDHELRHGRIDEAEEAFRAGLAMLPGDYRLLSAMARLEAARRDWPRAIEYGEKVIGKLLDPATLGLLSEVHEASGEPDKAAEYAAVMQVAIQGQAAAYHREWSLFLLDRGQQLPEVLAQAREELKDRRDIYGYDLLAWALHKNGDHPGARQAMASALRLGTRDALLLYHAGMIERAAGNGEAAERYLEQALEIHPRFHPIHADEAVRALRSIRGARPWYKRLGR